MTPDLERHEREREDCRAPRAREPSATAWMTATAGKRQRCAAVLERREQAAREGHQRERAAWRRGRAGARGTRRARQVGEHREDDQQRDGAGVARVERDLEVDQPEPRAGAPAASCRPDKAVGRGWRSRWRRARGSTRRSSHAPMTRARPAASVCSTSRTHEKGVSKCPPAPSSSAPSILIGVFISDLGRRAVTARRLRRPLMIAGIAGVDVPERLRHQAATVLRSSSRARGRAPCSVSSPRASCASSTTPTTARPSRGRASATQRIWIAAAAARLAFIYGSEHWFSAASTAGWSPTTSPPPRSPTRSCSMALAMTVARTLSLIARARLGEHGRLGSRSARPVERVRSRASTQRHKDES